MTKLNLKYSPRRLELTIGSTKTHHLYFVQLALPCTETLPLPVMVGWLNMLNEYAARQLCGVVRMMI